MRTSKSAPTTSSSSRKENQKHWDEFFRSVFSEMATAVDEYDAQSYHGLEKEAIDVLRYYETCRGDMDRVVNCVVHGKEADK